MSILNSGLFKVGAAILSGGATAGLSSLAKSTPIGRAFEAKKQVGNILGSEGQEPPADTSLPQPSSPLGVNTDLAGSMGYNQNPQGRYLSKKYNWGNY